MAYGDIMPSFDVVCEVNLQELDNAVNQACKEISTRFDFRGGRSTLSFEKGGPLIKIVADDELKLRSIHQILETKVAKRSIDCRILDYGSQVEASGNLIKQDVKIRSGLEKEEAKQVIKKIKDSKMKVQSQIQDNQVRVSGKKIDDLQKVISMLKNSELSFPVQFINMRS